MVWGTPVQKRKGWLLFGISPHQSWCMFSQKTTPHTFHSKRISFSKPNVEGKTFRMLNMKLSKPGNHSVCGFFKHEWELYSIDVKMLTLNPELASLNKYCSSQHCKQRQVLFKSIYRRHGKCLFLSILKQWVEVEGHMFLETWDDKC